MSESKWNGVRYDFGDETEGPFDGPEASQGRTSAGPSVVSADLARRKRRPAQPAGGAPPANSTREYYDRQLAQQDQARQAGVAAHGMTDLAARTSQAADMGQAGVQANAQRQAQELQRRDALRQTLIQRVQAMMLPFQRAGLPPIGGR